MALLSDKARRSWAASLIFLGMILGLVLFLTFVEIPPKNKDLVTSIVGMIVGGISTAISIFVGRDPDDIKELKETIITLNGDRTALIERLRDAHLDKERLTRQFEALQTQIISRLSIFIGEETLKRVGKPDDVSQIVERYVPKEKEVKFSSENMPQVSTAVPKTVEPRAKIGSLDDIFPPREDG